MHHILTSALVLLLGVLMMGFVHQRLEPQERLLAWLSYVAHIIAAFALLGIYTFFYGGKGDIFNYERYALQTNAFVRLDFGLYFPELLKAFFQQPSQVDSLLFGPGTTTGSMSSATAIGFLFLGDSLIACCLLFAMLSFSGKLASYIALRREFSAQVHRRLMLGIMLTPSAVFWTAGVVKEALAIFGMGWLIYGLYTLAVQRRVLLGATVSALSAPVVFMVKPYILLPLFIAGGIFFFLRKSKDSPRQLALISNPIYLIVGLGVSLGAVLALGELAPRFAIDNITKEAATLHQYAAQVEGGSNLSIDMSQATTLSEQAVFAPLALINALFRPFIFEVHNPVALLNGLETTAILGMLLWGVRAHGPRELLRLLFKSPAITFSLVFVVLFGLGVGLGTSNLGTLSRYRVPMMPFYVASLLLLIPYGRFPWERAPR